MREETEDMIIASVKKQFSFLSDNGYYLGPIKHTGPMGCWEIVLESDKIDVIFKLISDRNQIVLVISNREEKFWVSLTVIVFFITDKLISFFGDELKNLDYIDSQLINLATVLKEHSEQINIIFGKNSNLYEEELIESMNKFRAIQSQGE